MKIDVKPGVAQGAKLSRKILQALNMLQQSHMELRETVLEALETNIMLEEDPPEPEQEAAEGEGGEADGGQDADGGMEEQVQVDTTWDDIGPFDGGANLSQRQGKADAVSMHSPDKTLREYLLEQAPYLNLDDMEHAMALAIIDAIDDRGYLAEPLEELAALFSSEAAKKMPAVLARIQKLDPPGVAARTPQECLQLQLRQLLQDRPEDSGRIEDALLVVDEAIKLLAAGEAAAVSNYFGWTTERAERAVELIRGLRPYPGADFESSPTRHVVPEVYVRRERSAWKVEISQGHIPRLRINPSYMGFMSGNGKGAASMSSMRSHLQEAQWLLESLRSRAEVVLKVSSCIVRHQENFLKFGEEALRPLTLEEVAQEVGVHTSTVSRATMGKHMHTPQGIYPFRFFFPSLVRTEYAVGTSYTAVKALIKKIVAAEDPGNPLSDGEISDSLENRGVKVARRTVAKYRVAMNIPARKDRRRGKAQ